VRDSRSRRRRKTTIPSAIPLRTETRKPTKKIACPKSTSPPPAEIDAVSMPLPTAIAP
jgi:hypothetical protein